MKKKRSVMLIISAILGVLYSAYLISYFGGSLGSGSGAEAVGGALATVLVTPHMVLVVIATIFNIIAAVTCKRGFALTGAILYTAAAVIFIYYGMFLIPMIILSFVGYARLKGINKHNDAIGEQEQI